MKIILSRKGFDTSYGGAPSPIFPSGEMCTLPIPQSSESGNVIRYEDIHFGNLSLGKLAHDLTRGKVAPRHVAHLDPDLNCESLPRLPGWKPLFGQAGAAESHLRNVRVQSGDLFLFYGWFREVEWQEGKYCYARAAHDLHVLFGWLQIEQRIVLPDPERIPEWARYHPHARREQYSSADSLYIATDHLQLPGVAGDLPGAGIFRRYHPSFCLTNTAPYCSRRLWRLPEWLHPTTGQTALTYHGNPSIWQRRDGYTQLRSASRGQEFVLDCDEFPRAVEWAAELLSHAGTSSIIN